jgi:hypothetical protein
MSLESATYIGQLVETNPTGTDPKSQGDDHLRLIKSVLQNQFGMATDGSVAVPGIIESTVGGVKFPDDTVQTSAGVTQAAADSRYVNVAGDVMTGNLQTPFVVVGAADGAGILFDGDQGRVQAVTNGGANLSRFGVDIALDQNDAVSLRQFPASVPGGSSPANYFQLPNGIQVRFGSGNAGGASEATIDFADFYGGCIAFVCSGDVNNPVVENFGARTRFSTKIISSGGGSVWGYSWIAIGA